MRGSLTVIGTGFQVAGQVTTEALAEIQSAERLFFVAADPATRQWLEQSNPGAESLYDAYAPGKHRHETYAAMTARILAPVRAGQHACAAFYGHPGVFVQPSHAAIRQARSEGYQARMLPAVSAEDCLFADLEVDPATVGCQSYEATHFALYRPTFDPGSALVLWQIGAVGVRTFETKPLWSRPGLALLCEILCETYSPDHKVVVYEGTDLPLVSSRIDRMPLGDLSFAPVTTGSTLFIPPARHQAPAEKFDQTTVLRNESRGGSLVLVGTGYAVKDQIDTQTLGTMRQADRLFYQRSDPASCQYLDSLNPTATALDSGLRPREHRELASERMTDRLLAPVREGLKVCAAFDGHPAICHPTAHDALRRARAEGQHVRMLPAVSLEDCLIADLGVDPATSGRALSEATDFLVRPRVINTTAALVLLQVGALALPPPEADQRNPRGIRALHEALLTHYNADQPLTIYEMARRPLWPPRVETIRLDALGDALLAAHSTLYIPPVYLPRADPDRQARLAAVA